MSLAADAPILALSSAYFTDTPLPSTLGASDVHFPGPKFPQQGLGVRKEIGDPLASCPLSPGPSPEQGRLMYLLGDPAQGLASVQSGSIC